MTLTFNDGSVIQSAGILDLFPDEPNIVSAHSNPSQEELDWANEEWLYSESEKSQDMKDSESLERALRSKEVTYLYLF